MEKLQSCSLDQLKTEKKAKKLLKEISSGMQMTMIGHLVDFNVHLGRSLIVDLEAPIYNRYRQVDHRTIQSIVLRNVKYKLGSKSQLAEFQKQQEEAPKKKEKWDLTKLKVGDWFSEMQYYKY